MYKKNKLVREGICSTGSYIELEVGNEKTYKFETPKGVFTVKGKIVDPVWKKPDWAFAEEGLPIPSPNDDSRFEYGVLGDYALNLGNGYLIHGTLYQRFLGMAVTHGCVRLSDGDLEYIYREMPVGAKVFIY
jgi:lipoprotein-anchoring transpeptidase ErfK/SrfK